MALQPLFSDDPVTLGPYELRGRLGAGGMGVVYLGFSPAGDAVAVKTLPVGVGADLRARLRREADLLSQVAHPRVARFAAADTEAQRPWLAMQYIPGPSLAEASKPLSPAALRHLTDGLADALAALHRVGLTHRDVKPGNIILTFDGPVLVDLGIAASPDATALTAHGAVVGTPAWMSPEQLTGAATTSATDVWGWAAVAYYAATGQPPFGDGPIAALAYRIQEMGPDLSLLPGWLCDAVAQGLSKNPATRPSAKALLAGPAGPTAVIAPRPDLTAVIEGTRPHGDTATAPPDGSAATQHATRVDTDRPRRRFNNVALGIGTALIVMAVAAVVLVLNTSESGSSPNRANAGPPTTPAASLSSATTRPSSTTTSVRTTRAAAPKPVAISPTELIAADACTAPCNITGKVRFEDPVEGPSTLVTVLNNSKNQGEEMAGDAFIAAVTDAGQVTWTYQFPGGQTWWSLKPAPKPTDDTGHVFLNYNPGRYNGVVVLDPTGDSFDDFGSLPPSDDPADWRFYSSAAIDPTHSGTYEIERTDNDCVPDCADGTEIHTVYKWTGTAYVKPNGSRQR